MYLHGVSTSVRNLWEGLKDKGHDVRILTFSDGLDSYKEGSVYYIKSMLLGFVYPDVRMPVSYRNLFIDELIEWKPDMYVTYVIPSKFIGKQVVKKLEKLFSNLGIDSHVIFVGMVEPSQVQEYYQLADVFVSASTSETQGRTYIGATANGLSLSKLEIMIGNEGWRISAGKYSEEIAESFDKSHFAFSTY